jgi:hypothetical protein
VILLTMGCGYSEVDVRESYPRLLPPAIALETR